MDSDGRRPSEEVTLVRWFMNMLSKTTPAGTRNYRYFAVGLMLIGFTVGLTDLYQKSKKGKRSGYESLTYTRLV